MSFLKCLGDKHLKETSMHYACRSSSFLLALPALLFSTTISHGDVTACILFWPDGYPYQSTQDYV